MFLTCYKLYFADKKAKRITSSLPNLNKSQQGNNSKLKAPYLADAANKKNNRIKQPQRMPTQKHQRSTTTASATMANNNVKKIGIGIECIMYIRASFAY